MTKLNSREKKIVSQHTTFDSFEKEYFNKHPENIEVCRQEIIDSLFDNIDMSDEEYLERIRTLIRLEGFTKVAKETKLSREHLYKSFSKKGNPTFSTLRKVMKYLGLQSVVIRKGQSIKQI